MEQNRLFSSCSSISSNLNRRDGIVLRASASQSVELGFISQVKSYQKTLRNGITLLASLLHAQHNRDGVENKPASLLAASLGKALNGIPLISCGRQVAGPSSPPVVVVQSY